MAVMSKIPKAIDEATPEAATTWAVNNKDFIDTVIGKHTKWLQESQVEKYQQAYDGDLESIDTRDKARGDDTNNKLFPNYAAIIIDTVTDYLLGNVPIWNVEDQEQADKETETPIVAEYRKRILKILKDEKTLRVLAEWLRQGCIAGQSAVITWVDENGVIDFDEYPIQEVIPVLDGRGRLKLVLRHYIIEENDEKIEKLEVYDDRHVTFYVRKEATGTFELDLDEIDTNGHGNPVEHKAARIPVSLFINGTAASYSKREHKAGTSDLGNGVYSLLEAYAAGMSDKANLADYLQDQYLLLKGVDTNEKEVLKMRKARAISLKSKDSDALFLAQSQEDKAVENYLDRLEKTIYDTTFTPKLSDLSGATATEVKMKYAGLDIKAGKKEVYYLAALKQFIRILTDLLNAESLINSSTDDVYSNLRAEKGENMYNADWLQVTLVRNLPQNYKEIADIVTELSGKVPDVYLYKLLWFMEDPVKALEEMKKQKQDEADQLAKSNMLALGYGSDYQNTNSEGDDAATE